MIEAMIQPHTGDDVHYVTFGSLSGREYRPTLCRAAKVTEIDSIVTTESAQGTVSLVVWEVDAQSFKRFVPRDETRRTGGTWHYATEECDRPAAVRRTS
jgi:hypothetical protein